MMDKRPRPKILGQPSVRGAIQGRQSATKPGARIVPRVMRNRRSEAAHSLMRSR